MNHHLDVAQPTDTTLPNRDRRVTTYVPIGDKEVFRPNCADDAAELRLIRSYTTRKPAGD